MKKQIKLDNGVNVLILNYFKMLLFLNKYEKDFMMK